MGWVWGVDPSTVRVAVAAVSTDAEVAAEPGGWHVTSVGVAGPRGSRLQLALRRTMTLASAFAEGAPPEAVWVEQPGGRNVSPQLWYVVGVVCAALEYALPRTPVLTVPPGRWKKAAFGPGKGNADKVAIMMWARELGYRGQVQDVADALGVATGGRSLEFSDPKVLLITK